MSNDTTNEDVHTAQAPHGLSDAGVRQFLRKYCAVANELGNDEKYSQLFTPDAQFIFASHKAVGRPGES